MDWLQIIAIVVAVRELARVIVAITPTHKDDEILDKISRAIDVLIGIKKK